MFLQREESDLVKEIQDRGKAIWVAELWGSQKIYQDDEQVSSTWDRLRLKLQFCSATRPIRAIHLKFRSNWVRNVIPQEVFDSSAHLFFTKKSSGVLGGHVWDSYIFGWSTREDSPGTVTLQTVEYAVPELLLVETSARQVILSDQRLIYNR